MTDFSQIGFKRDDIHTPVNFLPENYVFVGCFHNSYTFRGAHRSNVARDNCLRLLALNDRPNGPGVSNCDHCGAAIAFVGVFQHKDGDYIAVGSTCAENRFPLSNAEFQRLRKEHRLSRNRDLREAEFEQYKVDHPEVDWAWADALAAATAQVPSTSANFRVRSILSNGRKYGSLTDSQLRYLGVLLIPAPAPVAPPVDPDQAKAQAFLRAYSGSNGFLNSLKSQVEAGRTLSPRQLECALKNVKEAQAPQVPKVDNSRLSPGIYVNAEGHVYKVQGNQAFKSAAKRQAKGSDISPYDVHGAYVYAKVWGHSDGSRINLSEVGDLSSGLHSLWIYERGLINQLVVDHRMTLTEARTFGELYSQCVNCGRTLTDEKSIDAAIGPVCIKQFPDWGHQELDHNHKEA